MGKYNFDQVIERRGTSSLKYDGGAEFAGRSDLLPLWVADMDFALPEDILARIKDRVDHGIFGYTLTDERYNSAVAGWFARRHGLQIRPEWITAVPGVVYALSTAVRAVTEPGDAVMIQEPVYYPFRKVIEQNDRICINNQLKLVTDHGAPHYEIDFEDFERRITDDNVRAFILCSPHNPVGRVWSGEELLRIADICLAHGVTVISDEIHCDFVYKREKTGSKAVSGFISYGALRIGNKTGGQDASAMHDSARKAIICTAPSKTFNIAGLQASNIIIPDEETRARFRMEHERNGLGSVNTLAKTAVEAVYEAGDEWLDELIGYLEGNIRYVQGFLLKHIPQVRLIKPEGTYLIWLDFSRVADTPEQMKEMIRDDAHLWLDNGAMFSAGGESWMFERMNIACPRSTLEQALRQLEAGVKKRLDSCYRTEWIMEWYRAEE